MTTRGKKSKAAGPKAMTKSQMLSDIAEKTGLTRVQAGAVLDALFGIVKSELKAGRPVKLSGMVKISTKHKAATAAHPGKNPFTGQSIMVKAKPARRVVKASALKELKDAVA